jgi:hypothetical protein
VVEHHATLSAGIAVRRAATTSRARAPTRDAASAAHASARRPSVRRSCDSRRASEMPSGSGGHAALEVKARHPARSDRPAAQLRLIRTGAGRGMPCRATAASATLACPIAARREGKDAEAGHRPAGDA